MDEDILKTEVENELMNKKQCSYVPYECSQLCLDGYKYCSKHILQDKNAPYRQCSYIFGVNGKRCNLPAPRNEKKDYGYCSEHALRGTLATNRQNSKHSFPHTAEVLLNSLSHYIKKPRIHSIPSHSDDVDRKSPDVEQKSSKFLDPFVDFDAPSLLNEKCNKVLDVCSDSESDVEASTYSSVWQDAHAETSEDESIDSENEDLLKHANVYTAEEVTLMTKDKLIRLQTLYIDQYRHLQYLLTEKRRKYLHSLKREKETCCNIHNQVRDNTKEKRLYKKLKALNNYHKYCGTDAILNKRLKDLRGKITDGSNKSQNYSKCTFTEGGVKCMERSLPLAKHCQKHILEDTNQVLFRACGKATADIQCTTPIGAIFEDSTCLLHLEIPPVRTYGQVRKDSESDVDESTEPHFKSPSRISESIETELMSYDLPPDIPKMDAVPTLLFEENPQATSDSSNTSSFVFGLNTSLSDENKTQESDARKAEECAQNMMELSRFVVNETQQKQLGDSQETVQKAADEEADGAEREVTDDVREEIVESSVETTSGNENGAECEVTDDVREEIVESSVETTSGKENADSDVQHEEVNLETEIVTTPLNVDLNSEDKSASNSELMAMDENSESRKTESLNEPISETVVLGKDVLALEDNNDKVVQEIGNGEKEAGESGREAFDREMEVEITATDQLPVSGDTEQM